MSYRTETTGAIAKALAALGHFAEMQKSISVEEELEIMVINAIAELDKLHGDNNIYSALLGEIQDAITYSTEEQAKVGSYGLPIPIAQKLYRVVHLHETEAAEQSVQRMRCTCRKNFEGAVIKIDPNCPLVTAAHR